MSRISRLDQVTSWKRALNAARRTIGKKPLNKEPSKSWEAKMILAEHSPVRLVEYDWTWEEIMQWVTVHLVRHHEGCEKFVHSQRGDRRDLSVPRNELPQGALNDMDMTANVQAIINISRKRLCSCASKETREAWKQVVEAIRKVDPILAEKCVPECLYRGFCPEFMSSCGYANTDKFQRDLKKYRNTIYPEYNMKYFSIKELCHSNTASVKGIDNTPSKEVQENLIKLVENVLDPLREWYGKPIYINSGYRCEALNKAVGGVPTSHHLFGYAVDIDMGDKEDNKPIFDYIKNNLPFTEMGWEGNGRWVHVSFIEGRVDKQIFYA